MHGKVVAIVIVSITIPSSAISQRVPPIPGADYWLLDEISYTATASWNRL